MVPARNLLLRHCNTYGDACDSLQFVHHQQKAPVIRHLMAEEDSSSSRKRGKEKEQEKEEEEEAGPSTATAKEGDHAETYEGWLQLGMGGVSSGLRTGAATGSMQFSERPPLLPTPASPALASTSPLMTMSYGVGQLGWRAESSGSAAGVAGELRVIIPPQRTRAGIWVALRPAENQVKEPFLPQLAKSYLKIKDGRMTVRLLMRYLANKLGLHDESEVELSCRGQQLDPFATLEEVRDQLWCLRDTEAPGPSSPATDHVMKLHYRRRA